MRIICVKLGEVDAMLGDKPYITKVKKGDIIEVVSEEKDKYLGKLYGGYDDIHFIWKKNVKNYRKPPPISTTSNTHNPHIYDWAIWEIIKE